VTDDRGAYEVIRVAALTRIEARRLRPDRDMEEVRHEVRGAVDDYERDARLGLSLPLGEPDAMAERVVSSVTDFGPLTELLARTDVEEVFVEGGRVSYLDTAGRLRGLTVPTSEEENRRIVDRLLASTDRHLSTKYPLVQARVLQGSARLTAAIAPVADRLSATLRRYTVCDVTLDELVSRESLNQPAADFLALLMQLRSRVVVSGEPGAGKTTLLGALLAAAPAHHCVRSCEEIRELAVPLVHGGYYEVRPAGLDGTGEIALRDLVKFVLTNLDNRTLGRWLRRRQPPGHYPQRSTAGSPRTATARSSASPANATIARPSRSGRAGRSERSTSTTTSPRTAANRDRSTSRCSTRSKAATRRPSSRGIPTGSPAIRANSKT
jgi:Flp pilus assembly CpaF family ATPase